MCIFIPSYNTEDFIRGTVERIPWASLPPGIHYELLFIDNASTDSTPAVIADIRAELKERGVHTHALLQKVNRGYGGSVKTAFGFCFDHGFEYMAVLHADGQYAPEELPRFIMALHDEPRAALHFGSRLTGQPLAGGMPIYKFLGNHALSKLQNLCTGLRLSEYHSGYRLYRLRDLQGLPWKHLSDGFVIDNEIICMIHTGGFLITESPIPTFYGQEVSHVSRIGTPCAILCNIWMYLLAYWGLRHDPRY
jgi:glycosyltransferase involved in cell wall biosynthesis